MNSNSPNLNQFQNPSSYNAYLNDLHKARYVQQKNIEDDASEKLEFPKNENTILYQRSQRVPVREDSTAEPENSSEPRAEDVILIQDSFSGAETDDSSLSSSAGVNGGPSDDTRTENPSGILEHAPLSPRRALFTLNGQNGNQFELGLNEMESFELPQVFFT